MLGEDALFFLSWHVTFTFRLIYKAIFIAISEYLYIKNIKQKYILKPAAESLHKFSNFSFRFLQILNHFTLNFFPHSKIILQYYPKGQGYTYHSFEATWRGRGRGFHTLSPMGVFRAGRVTHWWNIWLTNSLFHYHGENKHMQRLGTFVVNIANNTTCPQHS